MYPYGNILRSFVVTKMLFPRFAFNDLHGNLRVSELLLPHVESFVTSTELPEIS